MLLISVGIGFLLLFGVLISDGISRNVVETSVKQTDTSSRTRKSDAGAALVAKRTIGARRPDDGIGRAA
jgi:hypothetical protein